MPTDYTDIEHTSKTAVRPEEDKQETKARNKPAVTGKVKKVKKGLLERLVVGMLGLMVFLQSRTILIRRLYSQQ